MNHKLQDKLYSHSTNVNTEEIWNGIQKKKKKRLLIPLLLLGAFLILLTIYIISFTSVTKSSFVAKNTNVKNTATSLIKDSEYTQKSNEGNQYTSKEKDAIHSSKFINQKAYKSQTKQSFSSSKIPLPASRKASIGKTTNSNSVYLHDNSNKNTLVEADPLKSEVVENVFQKAAINDKLPKSESIELHSEKSSFPSIKNRNIINIQKIETATLYPNIDLSNYKLKTDFILPLKNRNDHNLTINIGTLTQQNILTNDTESLLGINTSLIYSRRYKNKWTFGIGINYTQYREHFVTVYNYTQGNEILATTTEIYNQNGTVELINSLITVEDKFERSISKVNEKHRLDISLHSEYSLFTWRNFSTLLIGQFNYNLLLWNNGLENKENFQGPYDINIDKLNTINKDNNLTYQYGLQLSYSLSERLLIGIRAQRHRSLNSFYIDQDLKYKGYIGGLSLTQTW